VASLLVKHGAAVITAAISPYALARAEARQRIGDERFVEVYVRCSLNELTRRDVKGLYAKAIAGELQHFTGVSDPYEAPENHDVVVDSELEAVEESVSKILLELERRGFVEAAAPVAS
jgi:adenylylsulfate kinase-like enzyme